MLLTDEWSLQFCLLVFKVWSLDPKLAASSDVGNKCMNSITLASLPPPYSLKGEWKSAFLPILILFLQCTGRVWEAETLQILWKSQDICPPSFLTSKFVSLSNIKVFFSRTRKKQEFHNTRWLVNYRTIVLSPVLTFFIASRINSYRYTNFIVSGSPGYM